jgi:hypothetical protein
MKKEGTLKSSKKGSNAIRRRGVRALKQKRFKKKPRSMSIAKNGKYAIVRIMGHGQFKVENRTAKKINKIDNELIKIIQTHEQREKDYARRLAEVLRLIKKDGLPLEHKEIIQSDIILPSLDLSIDEAKKLFKGEG